MKLGCYSREERKGRCIPAGTALSRCLRRGGRGAISLHSQLIGQNWSLGLNRCIKKLQNTQVPWINGEHNSSCHTVLYFLGKLQQYLCSWMKTKKIYCGWGIRSTQPDCLGLSMWTWFSLVFVNLRWKPLVSPTQEWNEIFYHIIEAKNPALYDSFCLLYSEKYLKHTAK